MTSEIGMAIWEQLGGHRFALFTGAKQFVTTENGLQFMIPRTKNIRKVKIELTGEDLYTVAFYSYNRSQPKLLDSVHAVDCNQLQKVFERKTGLETHL